MALESNERDVLSSIEPAPSSPAPAPSRPPLLDDRAWGVDDVAYFLNQSESLVRKLERLGKLPALPRISRRLTFDPQVVRAFRAGTLNAVPLRASSSR